MQTNITLNEIKILGIKVHVVNMDETVSLLHEMIKEGQHCHVVTVGTEMIMAAQENYSFAEIINKADLVVPDTSGVLWAAKRIGAKIQEKVTGIDLTGRLLSIAAKDRFGVFLLGGKPGIAELASKEMIHRYPGLIIAGTHDGYFKAESNEEKKVIEKISSSSAKLLLVGMGFPRQEEWLSRCLKETGAIVGIGVGGSFDVFAGTLKRAPRWMIRLHIEWLFRLFQEPKRWRRMLAIPMFMLKVITSSRR